jgi:hypothetical protein
MPVMRAVRGDAAGEVLECLGGDFAGLTAVPEIGRSLRRLRVACADPK